MLGIDATESPWKRRPCTSLGILASIGIDAEARHGSSFPGFHFLIGASRQASRSTMNPWRLGACRLCMALVAWNQGAGLPCRLGRCHPLIPGSPGRLQCCRIRYVVR